MGRCPGEGRTPMPAFDADDLTDLAATESLRVVERGVAARRRQDQADALRWQESIAESEFDQARSRHELNQLLHYGHFIPITRGFTRAFVERNYPRWSWNELIEVLKAADIVRGPKGSPPHCLPALGAVHFNHDGSWLVEWEDGHVTTGRYVGASL